ncbi:glycosyltransferase [Collinsella sp. An268]|uniref:glycosyltransferase family 2 protein n=1 Tax=Collinsella sp. An268 TaxID=1965612 RepID=UPI000B37FB6C|nr:glycosyltransferase [Collinsella sp. An268]OUO63500.1 glycosyl transferase family 2 [Collinsella sp. An268]
MFTKDDHTFAVCAYGESPYLEQCLYSLREQELHTNVIISTSTPNDAIRRLAKRYKAPLFINEGEPGIGHDWNCAISHCQTPLVTIAHQDDIYLPAYAKIMLSMMNEEEKPLIWFSDYGELRGDVPCDDSRLLAIKRLLLNPLKRVSSRQSVFVRRRALSLGSSICCPAVTYCRPNLPDPVFLENMKCDLDWQAWERFSRLEGSYIYAPQVLMRHRIHEGSETTALIKDDTRTKEDLVMLRKFWPAPIARFINGFYSKSQASNQG